MKIYKIEDWEYWYDRSAMSKCWWAARFDAEGNQTNDAIHAYSKDDIVNAINSQIEG